MIYFDERFRKNSLVTAVLLTPTSIQVHYDQSRADMLIICFKSVDQFYGELNILWVASTPHESLDSSHIVYKESGKTFFFLLILWYCHKKEPCLKYLNVCFHLSKIHLIGVMNSKASFRISKFMILTLLKITIDHPKSSF